ncbi:MAG TPA: helix-turn-helix transcriptional regulator [Castellaniella sp.]|uniref:helix-turn-helix domain-containing protein n=1 Tax=Castellaniella sp. TaxID=1955812 RepID=UPI002F009C99
MSDLPNDGLNRPDAGGAPQGSLGDALKALREARGLTLAEASARTKYSALQLGYLEACSWDRLPHGVPLRGLVRNYVRYLQGDVEASLKQLDDTVGPTGPQPTVTALSARRALQQADITPAGEPAHRTWAWLLLILILFCVVGFYAIDRGWVPDQWLIFDWLKALRP